MGFLARRGRAISGAGRDRPARLFRGPVNLHPLAPEWVLLAARLPRVILLRELWARRLLEFEQVGFLTKSFEV